jgi:hypothetical protein
MNVTIVPGEAWLSPLQLTATLVVISPVVIVLLVLVLLVSAFFIVRLIIARKPSAAVNAIKETERVGGEVAAATSMVKYPELSGKKSEILTAYLHALELVSKACGDVPQPQTTLREYLLVARRLNGAFAPFKELTGLAEMVLYAPRLPDSSLVTRSEQLADNIERELRE